MVRVVGSDLGFSIGGTTGSDHAVIFELDSQGDEIKEVNGKGQGLCSWLQNGSCDERPPGSAAFHGMLSSSAGAHTV